MSQNGCLHKGGTPRASNPPSPALSSFRGGSGPMLTDSGGYQIFSMGYGSVPGSRAVVAWAGSLENIVTRNTPFCFPVACSPRPQPFKILLPFVRILCFSREFPPVFLPVVFFLPSQCTNIANGFFLPKNRLGPRFSLHRRQRGLRYFFVFFFRSRHISSFFSNILDNHPQGYPKRRKQLLYNYPTIKWLW